MRRPTALAICVCLLVPLLMARAPAPAERPTTVILTAAPAQQPDPCQQYSRLESGQGEAHLQRWFDHQDYKGYARFRLACLYHGGASEWRCLDTLWEHESRWLVTAGRQRGSYGIAQAFPGTRMASAGPDWRTNGRVQIRWGENYLFQRYHSSPCYAWGLWQSRRPSWY